MKKSIFFKAKRVDNGEWDVGTLTFGDMLICGKLDRDGLDTQYSFVEIDPSTLCRCVEIEDKTGNILFEHDIIEKESYTDCDAYVNSEGYVGVLQWTEDLCSWDIRTSKGCRELSKELEFTDFKNHCKVVGNEFDNPELLEQFHIPSMSEKVIEDKEEMEL